MAQLLDLLRAGGSTSTVSVMHACRPIDCGYQLLRLGGAADGGYLVPDDLHGLRALFSPGVAESSALEMDFAGRGIPCFLADRSVAGPAEPHPLFHFTRKHLGTTNDSSTIRLADWIDAHCPGSDDLALQMDIEGAEYRVLQDCPAATLQRFRIIVIELHHCARIARPWANGPIINLLRRLLETHAVAHVHANNQARPRRWFGLRLHPLLEFTFLRRDRLRGSGGPAHLPHPLDRPNVPSKPEWALDPAWLR
jgi:hypothetical protein